jgi:hypothetical protein
MGLHLMGVYLTGICLIGVHFTGRACIFNSRSYLSEVARGCNLPAEVACPETFHGERCVGFESVRAHPPTNPVGQQIDLLAIGPAYTTCNTVCI